MRVCFPFTGDSIGGSHLSSIILIKRLISLGYEIVVLIHEDGPLTREFEQQNISFEKLELPTYVSFDSKSFTQLYKISITSYRIFQFLRARSIDVVHTNDARMHITWSLPAKVARVPHVWHQRTVLAPSRLGSVAIKFADAIACISEYVVKSWPDRLMHRSTVIPNAVENIYVDPNSRLVCRERMRNLTGIRDEFLVVGTFGNLRDVKDPLTVVRAFGKMQQLWATPLILAVFGEDRDGYTPAMMDIAKNWGVADKLLLLGFKRPIEPWISACDVVFAASRGDAFGRTIIEAMQLGVPVVATEAGGHIEIVDHMESGLLVQVGNHSDMAIAGVKILENPALRDKLVMNGKRIVATTYSVDTSAKRITEIYSALGSGRYLESWKSNVT